MWHPVCGIGKLIEILKIGLVKCLHLGKERESDRGKKIFAGILLVILTLAVSTGIPLLLLYAAGRIHPYVRILLECFWCYQLLAAKSLYKESMKVYDALKAKDPEGARYAVSMIVGRDTERLDEKGIIKAAVETVAENTSDGVTAPLLFLIFFGVPGGFFYKAVNTMDSMVGYKNDEFLYLGRAAAKLDDVVNFIPARISAWLMIAVSWILGMDGENGKRIYLRDRGNHASPNSAQTEAVCAGALHIQLGGDAWYFGKKYQKPVIGDEDRAVEPEDIKRANKLMLGTGISLWILGVWLLLFFSLMLQAVLHV